MTARVLVACERSGVIRNAFGAAGFDVTSVDTLPSPVENVGNAEHVVADVTDFLDLPFDLVIARPPCTYLANSGARWLYSGRDEEGNLIRDRERWENMEAGATFFRSMLNA